MIMAVSFRLMLPAALAVALIGCGTGNAPNSAPAAAPPATQPVVRITQVAPDAAQAVSVPDAAQAVSVKDARPVIVAFGDSLTAGFGLEAGQGFPEVLQRLLDSENYRYRIVNMGVSGDTTTDGVERLSNVLALHPAIVILEFGANDGLRGQPVTSSRKNLATMIEALQNSGARIVLAGMTLPRNYGPEYIHSFERIFPELGTRYKLVRIPFLLDKVGGIPELTQPDGLHPTAQGAEIVAHTVMQYLRPLLRK